MYLRQVLWSNNSTNVRIQEELGILTKLIPARIYIYIYILLILSSVLRNHDYCIVYTSKLEAGGNLQML